MNFQKIKADLQHVYDDLALYWESDKTLHDWGEDDLIKFTKLVDKGAKVLDLGCASGYQSQLLLSQKLQVVGLDLSPKMITVAKKRVPNVDFVVGDMTNLTFKSATFDGVYARASLLHVPKRLIPKVLKSVNKILKDNGIFYLAVKEGENEGEVEDERHGIKVKRYFSFFTESEIKKSLKNASFRVESVTSYQKANGFTNWIKIFARKV